MPLHFFLAHKTTSNLEQPCKAVGWLSLAPSYLLSPILSQLSAQCLHQQLHRPCVFSDETQEDRWYHLPSHQVPCNSIGYESGIVQPASTGQRVYSVISNTEKGPFPKEASKDIEQDNLSLKIQLVFTTSMKTETILLTTPFLKHCSLIWSLIYLLTSLLE